MRTGIMLLSILLFTSCLRKPIPVSYSNTEKFVLEDTTGPANEYLQSFGDDAFPIYYIGPWKDTIRTGSRYWLRQERRFKEYPKLCIFRYSKSHIAIQVDTSSPVCEAMEYLKKDGSINHYCDSNRYYHASMIIIRNKSDTAVSLGITFSVFQMHREMLNSRGQWVKTSEKLCKDWFCGTGQPNIYLMPGELIVSKISHFSGKHAVRCRLALGCCDDIPQVYSNIFTEHVTDELFYIVEEG